MRRSAFLIFTLISGTVVLFVSPLWTQSPQGSGEARANAVIRGFTDPAIEGSVSFDQKDDMSVRITGEIRGLTAGQTYAIHVHEWGDCGEPNASGGHFDPFGSEHHGNPDGPIGTHHSGDLPNIQADQKGVAQLSFSTKGLTVPPSPYSVLGHAVVLHEHADDYSSQPAGNAGNRVACGVIGLVRD